MNALLRWFALVLLALLAVQVFFVLHIAALAHTDPASTTFQRTQIWAQRHKLHWQQHWVPYSDISEHLKRAVIAAEDSGFASHSGVDWAAFERAWLRSVHAPEHAGGGGSTITQQLAKNLLLSGERTAARKAQEILLTLALEQLLPKQRILEIYLNSIEWGSGIFGAQAAAQHYWHKNASQLGVAEAAHLAVMLPAPKLFEQTPHSAYLTRRARAIRAGMALVQLP